MGVEKNRARTLGALVLVAIVLLLVARFVIRKDQSVASVDLADDDAEVVSIASSAPTEDRAAPPAKAHARYESALVSTRVDGISSGAGTALAVGENGTILRYEIEHPSWRAETSPTHVALHAVAQQLDEAIAVGDEGTIAERDESGNWTLADSGTKHALHAVVYTSYGAFAAGDGGTLLHRFVRHEPWRAEESHTTRDLYGACAGLRDVWIVGKNGTIAGHTSNMIDAWKVQQVGTATLFAVACDDHAALAVGAKGAMVERLDDVSWHESTSGVTVDLFAVAAPIGTQSFLVAGASATVLHVTGTATAEPQVLDPNVTFYAVSEGALGTWLAGDHGIFRRAPM